MSQNIPIKSFANQSILDRTGEDFGNVWIANTSTSNIVSQEGPFLFTGKNTTTPSTISNLIESCTDRLFISTSSFSDSNIIQAVEEALRRSVRVYILLDTTGFESILSNASCSAIIGNVLLRERLQRGLDMIVSDWHLPTTQGLVLSTPLDGTLSIESSGWAMKLDKNQIDELSKHVQHEFWSHRAPSREVLSSDESHNPPEIAQAPAALGSIYNGDHVLRANLARDGDDSKAEAALRKEKNWQGQVLGNSSQSSIILHGDAIEVGTGAEQVIHSSPKSVDPATGLFAHSGLSLQVAVGTESYLAGWDRSATGDWHSILRLNAEQAKAAKALLQKHSKSPEWVGHSKIKLGDAGEKIIRDGTEMTISATQKENLGVIHLDKMPDSADVLKSHQPPLNPSESALARECTFEWICAPPVVPSSASEDVLHSMWNDARNTVEIRLNALDEVNKPSSWPGFGRKAKELKKNIENALTQSSQVSESKEFSDLVEIVEELSEEVGSNLYAIKAVEAEEERKKLEDEQREAHKITVDKAKASVKNLEPRLKKMNAELQKLKKSAENAKDIEKEKLDIDVDLLFPKIQLLGSELNNARDLSNSNFEFIAPATLPSSNTNDGKSHRFLGDTRESKLEVKIPKEGLPQFGTLYKDGGVRYLAVSDWTHVEQGREDAMRLKATLCASRKVLG